MYDDNNDWFQWASEVVAKFKDDNDRFKKLYSGAARRVVREAIEEAERTESDVIGAEHLFISFAISHATTASMLPQELSLAAVSLTEEIRSMQRGGSKTQKPSFSPRMSSIIRNARKEAASLGKPRVEPEHMLLALLAESGGILAQLLEKRQIDREAMHTRLIERLSQEKYMKDQPNGPNQPPQTIRTSGPHV